MASPPEPTERWWTVDICPTHDLVEKADTKVAAHGLVVCGLCGQRVESVVVVPRAALAEPTEAMVEADDAS